jgi:hypothetical protein
MSLDCRGDVDQLRRLVDSKVNPDVGEHDARTALHQVAKFLFDFRLKCS